MNERRSTLRPLAAAALAGAAAVWISAGVPRESGAQAMPPGISRASLLENDTVMMARLTFAPGAREDVHTHPFSAVVVQIEPGDVEMRLGPRRDTERREAGHVEFIAAEMPHAAANVGTAPFDVVTIAVKPDRVRGGTQAASAAPPGILRAPLLDNAEARATEVTFSPGAREPVHSHPFDMAVVAVTAARMEVQVGSAKGVKNYAAGEVVWLPRDIPHAIASADQGPFTLISVGVK